MRWEGEVKHAELTPVRVWSKRDEGNFGGRSLFDEDNSLSHHGIPGMKWGVKTKEYVKKGYDTLKRRQAILKMKRKKEYEAQKEEGYKRGQRVAANTYFIQKKVNPILEKKNGEEKPKSLYDRAVKSTNKLAEKGVDYVAKKAGLDQTPLVLYLDKAKDVLKDRKNDLIDNVFDSLKTEDGQLRLQKVATFLGKSISKTIGAGEVAAPYVRKGLSYAGQAAKSGLKAAGRGAINAIKSGHRWLHTGNPTGSQRIRNTAHLISEYGKKAYNAAQIGMRSANAGARAANNSLNDLLSRRLRRR